VELRSERAACGPPFYLDFGKLENECRDILWGNGAYVREALEVSGVEGEKMLDFVGFQRRGE
jgi:hypothetical protein